MNRPKYFYRITTYKQSTINSTLNNNKIIKIKFKYTKSNKDKI